MGKIRSYKELEVWKKGLALTRDVYALSGVFPQDEKFGLTNQMRRAAASVPANIAEGWTRSGTKEFLHFLNIASGSLAELDTFMEIAGDLGYTKKSNRAEVVKNTITEIQKMTCAMMRSLNARLSTLSPEVKL